MARSRWHSRVQEYKAWLIDDAMARHNGAVGKAAADLGISRTSMYAMATECGAKWQPSHYGKRDRSNRARLMTPELRRFLGIQ